MTRYLIATVLGIACAVSAYAAPAPPARCEKLKLVAAGKVALKLLAWVDDYLGIPDTPLPFGRAYRQKAAFFGIRDALLGF